MNYLKLDYDEIANRIKPYYLNGMTNTADISREIGEPWQRVATVIKYAQRKNIFQQTECDAMSKEELANAVYSMYIEQNMKTEDIAKSLNVSRNKILKAVQYAKENNLYEKSIGQKNSHKNKCKKFDYERLANDIKPYYIDKNMSPREIAPIFNTTMKCIQRAVQYASDHKMYKKTTEQMNQCKHKNTMDAIQKKYGVNNPYQIDKNREKAMLSLMNSNNIVSLPQRYLYHQLQKIFGEEVVLCDRNEISPYEIDIYIPSLKIAIEYDGQYYHNDSERDIHKDELCKQKGISIVHVRETKLPRINDTDIFIVPDYKELEFAFCEIMKFINKTCRKRIKYNKKFETFIQWKNTQGD